MTNAQIKLELQLIFTKAKSPGEAFDAIIRLRNADVGYSDIERAFKEQTDDLASVDTGAKRADVIYFGKYRGKKTLRELAVEDPAYLRWALENATCINDDYRVKIEKALEDRDEPLEDDPDNVLPNY